MEIRIPTKPEITQQPDKGEDLRKFAVIPFGAIFDKSTKPFELRVLAAIASYANRAGVSYVSQYTLAKMLKSTQPRISVCMTALKRAGWLKEIGKPVNGLRGATVQIMYAPDMDIRDAVAIASAKTDEDLRPPEQREDELAQMIADDSREWTEEELRANKERLAKMLLQAFKTPADKPRLYEPVAGDTLAVKKAKQEIRARMRTLRKEEYANKEPIQQDEYNHKYLCLDTTECIGSDSKQSIDMQEKISDQREPMTYEAIVEFLKNELFSSVKSENDLQGCAWLADIRVTHETLSRYVTAYPSDTAYQLAKRVIADA